MTKPEFAELQPEDGAGQNPKASARARRRRAHRMVIPQDAQGQSALLGSLTRRAYPSYDLFIFAILSGAVLGLGYLLDSQAVLLLGILIAPLLTPWAGMLIGLLLGFGVTVISLILAFVLKNHGDFFAIIGISALPATFLSSAFVPLDSLPLWMRLIAWVNPMTYMIDAMRSLILSGWDLPLLVRMAIVLLVFDGAMFWLGGRVLRRHLA